MKRALKLTVALGAALSLGACAESNLMGASLTGTSPSTTASLPPKPKVDPACVTLAQQIDALRQDGVVGRAEKAAQGKTKTVSVKRDSLGKLAQLDKLNAEFGARCSTLPRAAVAKPVAPVTAQPVAAKTAAATAATTATKTAAKTAATAVKTEAPKQ